MQRLNTWMSYIDERDLCFRDGHNFSSTEHAKMKPSNHYTLASFHKNHLGRIRHCSAFTLVEMVVAIGVSAVFVLMLAGLLSQTLQVSGNVQKQLNATAVAELAVENAKNTPYSVLSGYTNAGAQTLNLYSSNNVGAVPRVPPLQFDLLATDTVFGSVNPLTGQIADTAKWTLTTGNHFQGTVKETVADAKGLTGLDSVKVDIDVSYDINGKQSKKISRTVIVFKND